LLCLAYALVLAGAIGNLVDRLVYGYVIDFLHVYYQQWDFPVFNIADVAISMGAALLLLDAFYEQKEAKAVNDAKD
jgi:signal peptidase II